MSDSPSLVESLRTFRRGRSSLGPYRTIGRSDDELLAFVRWAYADLGEKQLTVRAYAAWRRKQLEAFDKPIPTAYQLGLRFGSFTEALHHAIPDIPRRGLRLAGPALVDRRRSSVVTDGDHAAYPQRHARDMSEAARDVEERDVEEKELPAAESDPRTRLIVSRVPALVAMAEILERSELKELTQHARRRLAKWPTRAAKHRAQSLTALADLLEATPAFVSPFRAVERKTYDERRPTDAPTSERLVRAYGSWLCACRAADGVLEDGRKAGPGSTATNRVKSGPKFSREEAVASVLECARQLGRVPTSSAYHRWSIEVHADARAGGRSVRIAQYSTLCRIFRPDAERSGRSVWSVVLDAARL